MATVKLNKCLNDVRFSETLTRVFRNHSIDHDVAFVGDSTTVGITTASATADDTANTNTTAIVVKDSSLDCECDNIPFPHCVIKNFIEDLDFVENLQDSLKNLNYVEKNNDLYKFKQTQALEKSEIVAVNQLKDALLLLKEKLSEIFNLKLTDKIDMFSAQYNYTDALLCHDDELEGRRFAYIYYLVDDSWSSQDGGCLDLIGTDDETGWPTTVSKTIVPARNSFVFFEVTPRSFHQVAEVLSKAKCRHSLSGWFHGSSVPRNSVSEEISLPRQPPTEIDEQTLYEWINPEYISPVTQSEVQEVLETDSETQLTNFILPEKYAKLENDIKSDSIKWIYKGPPNKRNYEVADENSLPESCKDLLQFFMSDAMFLIMSNLTGLKLHPLAPESDDEEEPESKRYKSSDEPDNQSADSSSGAADNKIADVDSSKAAGTVSYQIRRWKHGSYTLLHDNDTDQGSSSALDVLMHFNANDWKSSYGGFTSYIAKGEDEELLVIEPQSNCLSIVYRDAEALRFVKHINHQITELSHPYIYDLSLVYHEPSES